MNASEPTPEFLAARLALLALRAGIGDSSPLDFDRVALTDTSSSISNDEAAQRLAAMPKPLFCDAEARDATLFVNCHGLDEATAGERQIFEMQCRMYEEHGGLMGFLEEYYGAEDHLVKVIGRGESLLLHRSVVERWSRDYDIRGRGHSGDNIDNPWSEEKPEYVEARREGAKGILRFWWPDTSQDRLVVKVVQHPLPDDASAAERRDADEQLVAMARHYRRLLGRIVTTDSFDGLPPPRSKWGESQRKDDQRFRTQLPQVAEMMKQVFQGREMPADVTAFVEECAKYFGPQGQ